MKASHSKLFAIAATVLSLAYRLPLTAVAADESLTVQNAPAPLLAGTQWFNTTAGASPSLASRQGQVTIVHFWTFGCINCKHNLPAYSRWEKKFAAQGVALIGVHTPETDAERNPERVAQFLRAHSITYPVLVDGDHKNWDRWRVRYWPSVFLVDKRRRVRYRWEGELGYQHGEARMSDLVLQLLREAN